MFPSIVQKNYHRLKHLKNTQSNNNLFIQYLLLEFEGKNRAFVSFLQIIEENIKKNKDQKTRQDIAQKYLQTISYISEEYGIYQEKESLDDLCFSITHPKSYENIKNQVTKIKKNSHKNITIMDKKLHEVMSSIVKNCMIESRWKGIYSVHKKMKKYDFKSIRDLHDVLAFRVIVEENQDTRYNICYTIIDAIHDTFKPIPEFYKDYISIPKPNNYQSLHTVVESVVNDKVFQIEIQVRTKKMHLHAKRGSAKHWIYKSKLYEKSNISDAKIPKNNIYIFTPTGDIMVFSHNTNAYSFAKNIHSDLANKTKHAIINNVKKPLNIKLKNGDIVHIKI